MRKITSLGLVLFIALFASPTKKKYISRKETLFFKTHYKLDDPQFIKKQDSANLKHKEDREINFFDKTHVTPKLDLIKIGITNETKKFPLRHQKGKIVYKQQAIVLE